MQNIKVSTAITITLLAGAIIFALMGFLSMPNSSVSRLLIAIFLVISSLQFGTLSFRLFKQQTSKERFLGFVMAMVSLFMFGFAIFSYITLTDVDPTQF